MKKNISILITEIFKDKSIFLDIGFSTLEAEVFYSLVRGHSLLRIAHELNIPLSSVRNIRDRRFYLIPIFIRSKLSYSNNSSLKKIHKTLVTLNLTIKEYFDHYDDSHKVSRIHELNLSTRTINALFAGNIKTVEDLSNLTIQDLQKFKNLGGRSIAEIINEFSRLGLSLKT